MSKMSKEINEVNENLNDCKEVRKNLKNLYIEVKEGNVPLKKAKVLVYTSSIILRAISTEIEINASAK